MHQIANYASAHHIIIAPKRQNRIPGRRRAVTKWGGGHFNFRQKIEINRQN